MNRDLTTLEYYVLGLISIEPQSGYSIMNNMEAEEWGGANATASPGSIYPILKRLEQQDMIEGTLELNEARARKMYALTEKGGQALDEWLKAPIGKDEAGTARSVLLMKFMFAERRLTHKEVIAWLDDYEKVTDHYVELLRLNRQPHSQAWSTHQYLMLECSMLELNMQKSWIQMARRHLQMQHRSGA
jgi:DNA-binding PadR family transcriptional regulator